MTDRAQRRLTGAVVIAGLGVLLVLGWSRREEMRPIEPGRVAPAYQARALDGTAVALEDFRGRVVLLNVWATWCAPCRWEMPALERVYRELRAEGLEVVAVSVDAAPGDVDGLGRSGGDVSAFVADYDLTFPVLLDPRGRIQERFGIVGLPTTFLLDRDGRVHRRVLGPAPWDREPYVRWIRELVEG